VELERAGVSKEMKLSRDVKAVTGEDVLKGAVAG
jgi:hypothetical protein